MIYLENMIYQRKYLEEFYSISDYLGKCYTMLLRLYPSKTWHHNLLFIYF